MITSIRCQNFKCFRDTGELTLAPITVLVGQNNSGKSAVLQALHLAALTLRSEDPSISLRLLHEDYDYGTFQDLVFGHDERSLITLTYGSQAILPRLDPDSETGEPTSVSVHLTLGFLRRRKEIYLQRFVLEDDGGERLTVLPFKYRQSQKVLIRGHEDKVGYLSPKFERRNFFFQPKADPVTAFLEIERKYGKEMGADLFKCIYQNMQLIGAISTSLRNVHHLGPVRVPPRRVYIYSGEFAERLGPNQARMEKEAAGE